MMTDRFLSVLRLIYDVLYTIPVRSAWRALSMRYSKSNCLLNSVGSPRIAGTCGFVARNATLSLPSYHAPRMSKPFQRAPFIAINTRTRWNANIHARNTNSIDRDTDNYLNLDGLSDLIGHCSMGDLYWNKECSSFGLVCGNSVCLSKLV
jgi:hypothetical protein